MIVERLIDEFVKKFVLHMKKQHVIVNIKLSIWIIVEVKEKIGTQLLLKIKILTYQVEL